MARIYVARRANRVGLYLPQQQSSQSPSLLFPLTKHTERGELDELVRVELEKQGISDADVDDIVDRAEHEYEKRVKVNEASKELRRLVNLRKEGKKLIQVGYRKWKEVWYPGKRRD